MAKSKPRSADSLRFEVVLHGDDAAWGRSIARVAHESNRPVEDVLRQALRDWLYRASGLQRLFDQIREANDLMARSFQVEGMLVQLAKSAGISMGQQSEYVKRAQDERALYNEQRRAIKRLVREVKNRAEEIGLPDAIAAASKLAVPD